ncbi:hypothetical protein HMPREF9975_12278 [Staphylococcus epidermidis NIHLM001]|nr:hypothetical protein HMPREF9975_12278 [Staphylococcus epidermidis NIHLM001]
MKTFRDISVQDSSYALEFIIVSLYTIDTASSNLRKAIEQNGHDSNNYANFMNFLIVLILKIMKIKPKK